MENIKLSERAMEALSYVIGTEERPPVMDKLRLKKLTDEMTDEEWTQFNKVYQLLTIGCYVGNVRKEDMEAYFSDA